MSTLKITKDNFENEVLKSEVPVLVDFWAPWCGPCKAVGTLIDEIAIEILDKAKVGKINIDEEPDLAAKYKVMSIPTLMVFKGGEQVKKSVGAGSKESIIAMID